MSQTGPTRDSFLHVSNTVISGEMPITIYQRIIDMDRFNAARNIVAILALCLAPVGFAANSKANGNGKPVKVDVIMVYDAKPDQAEKARVKALGGKTKREFENFNMRVISISENALKNLDNGKGVRFVARDTAIESFSAAARQTAGQPVAGSANSFAVDSTIGIAVLDSGVAMHSDINVASRMNCTISAAASNDTFADNFSSVSYSNNDG